jgi:hypothetical protein
MARKGRGKISLSGLSYGGGSDDAEITITGNAEKGSVTRFPLSAISLAEKRSFFEYIRISADRVCIFLRHISP